MATQITFLHNCRKVIFLLARECLAEFKLDCQLRRLSARTVRGYYNNVALFLNFVEKKFDVCEVEQIRAPHLKSYSQYLLERGLSASYSNGVLKSLRAFFKYVEEEEYILQNPAARVRWQKEGKVLITTFSDEEVKALLSSFDTRTFLSLRNKLILAIAFDTGARNTEICNILNDDIRDTVILIHGKGNKERNVPLTPYLKKLMLKYERMRETYFYDRKIHCENYLLSRTGRALTKEALEHIFNQANERAKVRANIRCSPHTARHYYAQANLRNGLDVYSLSRLLGHENINITKRYLQSLQDDKIVEMAIRSSPLAHINF